MPLVSRVLDRQAVGSLTEYVNLGGGIAAHAATEASPEEIIDLLIDSGLRGRGGAGFPTGTKWRTVAAARSGRGVTTVVVNAAEGEPGTFKDRALLRTNPYRVLEGAIVAARTLQTGRIRIGIKATFEREIDRLTTAINELRDARWIDDLDIALVLGPSSYLFGEETAMLEVVEGRQPFPRVTPPYRRGVFDDDTRSAVRAHLATTTGTGGAPALVDNVETLANVPLIIENGVEWFRELGTDRSPGSIVCTVSGATRRTGVGEVAMGSTIREVIESIGWGPRRGREIRIVVAGTANALIPGARLDTPLTYEAMRDAGSGLGSAGFIVFDDTTDPVAVAAGIARFLSVESCGQCEPCKIDGLQIANELQGSLQSPADGLDLDMLRRRATTVAIGARCNLAQQQAAVTESLLELFPAAVRSRTRGAATLDRVTVAPIEDIVGGRARLDTRQLAKQPDWSYDGTDSGAAPAARLGNTPLHISDRGRRRQWPAWAATSATEHPLALIDDAHDAIDALIHLALTDDDPGRVVDDLVLAVRRHIDVTQRVLYPMARRIGKEEGDRLADAAEAHEHTLVRLLRDIGDDHTRDQLQHIGVEMQAHADLDDAILELLRSLLDPAERRRLADGLATAQSTSTVRNLRRHPAATTDATIEVPQPSAEPAPAVQADDAGSSTAAPAPPAPPAAPEKAAPAATEPAVVVAADQGGAAAPRGASSEVAQRRRRTARGTDGAIRRILVGVDGSAPAAAALGWAGRLAARVGAEVVVGHVFETTQAEVPPDDYARLLTEAEQRLVSWSLPLRETGVEARSVLLTGGPDRLLTAIGEQRADMLVVGTRGAGRFAALHIGSLAHHLAQHTTVPLAIVPASGAELTVDRIVVGVDGSPGSAHAVQWCADVAADAGAEVIAVCAFPSGGGWVPRLLDMTAWRATAELAISHEWIAPLVASGVKVRTSIIEGQHPVSALARAAEDEDAGLLLVGTRGLSDVLGRRLGRVPVQLVHHTHRPVILVPADDEE
jgi:NADH:ubiquinone oxidoreductase subunit F (NADH-binding)/nucleotide-binding universal stress UspA family protein